MPARLTDSRRLTGANLYWDHPSAIIDLAHEADVSALLDRWEAAAARLLDAVGHGREKTTHRLFDGGASLLISAPVDALYAMCELNEAAFSLALAGKTEPDGETVVRLQAAFAKEANPALLALQAAARAHDVPFLWDDDHVSVGFGAGAQVWTPDALPDPEDVDWTVAGGIPVAMVTGTNGKSTTVRMAAAMIAAQGLQAGLTSTDWIRVGHQVLDTGDYSGTGGARMLLRHPQTEIAVLETARGGLLRRGLGVENVSTALITNVAADHLGEYGIHTVTELTEAKFIVRRALPPGAPLVLNADDPHLVAYARTLDTTLTWFSLDPENPVVQRHLAAGGKAAVLRNGWLELMQGEDVRGVVTSASIPATLNGAARHNIANALGAVALCDALGISIENMREGLEGFRGDADDNPGRGNWFEKNGVRILVDFAHNEHGMKAQADMLSLLPAKRRILLMSQAGDRLDRDIDDMVRAACGMRPDLLLVCDLPGYERGRQPGEVPAVIEKAALACGMTQESIAHFPTPEQAVRFALTQAHPGDLLALFVLTQRDEALALIHEFLDH